LRRGDETCATMLEKLMTATALLSKAVSRPGVAVLAIRQRGWRNVLATLMRAEPAAVTTMVRELQSQLPPTPENLSTWYGGVRFVPVADERLYKVRLSTGEEFLIRRSRAWQDLGTLHEVFIDGVYADHPPIAGKTVLDVGANIGDTAVYFAKRGARVIAFEPDPAMCELARRNVDGNGLRADIRCAGVGAAAQTLALSATRDGADTRSATLFPGHIAVEALHSETTAIQVVALADVLAELAAVDLAKIDCQGCEYPSLRSLTRADLRRIKHVMMEYHGASGELGDKLRGCGFSVRLKGTMYLYAERIDDREGTSVTHRE
jgi:FkbM family methyltransferase